MSQATELAQRLEKVKGPKHGQYMARCPYPDHEDKNPSFSFSEQGVFNCFGCGRNGHLNELGRDCPHLGISARTKTPGPRASKAEAMRALEVNRGLRAETIEKFEIGYSPKRGSYAYPCDNGAVRLKGCDDRQPRYSWEQAGRTSAVYGLRSALSFKGDRVFLCEGEPDVWTMQQAGLAAVTFTSGCNSVPEDGIQTLAESRFTEVSIIYDHDDPGRKGRWKAAAAIEAKGMSVRVFDLPDSLPPGSDVSDYYNVLDRNDEAFREAISNLEQLTDSSSKPEQDPPLTHKDRSDSDNATRFVDLHGDCLHFVPKWKKWIVFLED